MGFPHKKYKRDYKDPRYIEFRKAVLKRDHYKCQMPSCSSKARLQIHHIIRYADNILLRFTISNGITLCRKHHDSIKGKEAYYAELFLKIVKRNTE